MGILNMQFESKHFSVQYDLQDCDIVNQIADLIDIKDYPEAAKLMDEDYFYDNCGYQYSGVYVLHLIRKQGIETFKKIYAGKEPLDKYLYDGFEKEAIKSFIGSRVCIRNAESADSL